MRISKLFPIKSLLFLITMAFALYACFLCSDYQGYPSGYEKLILLPLSFFIAVGLSFLSLFRGKKLNDNIPGLSLILLAFIRNVVTPIAMVKDSFQSSLGIANATSANISIWLVSYETIVIFLFFYIVEIFKFKQKGIKLPNGKANLRAYRRITVCMVAIAILSLLLVPSLRNSFYSVFTSGFASGIQLNLDYRESAFTRALATGGDMAISSIRYILPCAFFYKLALRGQKASSLLISCLLVLAQSFFMTDSNAYILMIMISQLLFIMKLYPKYRKTIIIALIAMVILFAAVFYFYRFALDHYSRSISLWLQSYLPGIANTAGIMNVSPPHNPFQLFIDFWIAVPFKAFIGLSYNGLSTAQLWREANAVPNQILSTVGQGYYYFGFALAPILSCFLIQISRKCSKYISSMDNALLCSAYIYFMIYSVCTPFVYNFCIYMQAFLQRTIFIFIIAYFSPYLFSGLNYSIQGE